MDEEDIFAAARAMSSCDQRQRFLAEACADNLQLRAQIDSLLLADAEAGAFLQHSPIPPLDAEIAADTSGTWAKKAATLVTPCDKPDRIGMLGPYEVIDVAGEGGMGMVLRAFEPKLRRVVALKIIHRELAMNPAAVKRFVREAATAAAVHHDHVVTIHAIDDAHQPPYIAMEFIEGRTLQAKIDSTGPLELTPILRIGSQIAAGLAAAHAQGLVHRDVKPANILLENGVERVKITDFGLARAVDDLETTQTGVIAGTPQFMSPEQAKGETVDYRSDLFSLGAVMYAMCTGYSPFRAKGNVAVLRRICDDAPASIRELNPNIPDWLATVIEKLLAKNPNDRWQTAHEVADLLSQALAHVQNPTLVDLPNIAAVRASRQHDSAWRPRDYQIAILLVAVALTGMIAASWLIVSSALQIVSSPPKAHGPFTDLEASNYQANHAAYLQLPIEYTNSIGMRFLFIPPGSCEMGLTTGEQTMLIQRAKELEWPDWAIRELEHEGPRRLGVVRTPFYIGKFEVTNGDFRKFVEATKHETDGERLRDGGFAHNQGTWKRDIHHQWRTPGPGKTTDDSLEDHPVVHVSWNDAQRFCQWLSKRDDLLYALPQEDQWEFAARAGGENLGPLADIAALDKHAWFSENLRAQRLFQPQPVGEKRANGFGLHDTIGNVWEWCSDEHPAPPDNNRVLRGGGWNTSIPRVSPAARTSGEEDKALDAASGFRVIIIGDFTRIREAAKTRRSP